MIDANNISIRRLIMHNIIAKDINKDNATTELEESLLQIGPAVQFTINQRLIDALGRNSKAFDLDILDSSEGSFYDLCHDINISADSEFISRSQLIAELLAQSQKRSSIPGGYLIIIDAFDDTTNRPIYIIIKAELHQALQYIHREGGNPQIELLDQIFLSPSQKLFKIGILYEKNSTETEPNARFGGILFDDQFRVVRRSHLPGQFRS